MHYYHDAFDSPEPVGVAAAGAAVGVGEGVGTGVGMKGYTSPSLSGSIPII
jgi:hypothetical protein